MNFVSQWLRISLLNLLLVAILGFVLRYKIAFSLPWLDQKNLLHSHSHFAFSGWVTQTLMLLLIYYLYRKRGDQILRPYARLLYANLVAAYGMLVSFIIQGYGVYSIFFSMLSIIISVFFAIYFWKDLDKIQEPSLSHSWFRGALIFSVLSALGPFSLAYIMAAKLVNKDGYLASVYFYLHFQYNGWFLFAGMGLLMELFDQVKAAQRKLRYAFYLFSIACVPTYFLSVLWLPISADIYYLLLAASIIQLIGWLLILQVIRANQVFSRLQFAKFGRLLLTLSAIAFTIKLLLQAASIHPDLSQLSYSFRPIIIGYLHLVLLGVTTIFIIGYAILMRLIFLSRMMLTGTLIFVAGIIINEFLLMLQGVWALSYQNIPHIQLLLVGAAIILMAGLTIMFIGVMRFHVVDELKS